MTNTLILLTKEDCVVLERLTYSLLNNKKNIKEHPFDEEIRLEVVEVLQGIYDICRKYWRQIPRKVRITDGKKESLLIASFLYRVAHSEEWTADASKKRCVDILVYAVS